MKCPSCNAQWNDRPAMIALRSMPSPEMGVMCACGKWFRLRLQEPFKTLPEIGPPLEMGWTAEEIVDWPGGMPPTPINACTRRYDDDGSSPTEALQREMATLRKTAEDYGRLLGRLDRLRGILLALREAEKEGEPLTLPQFGYPADRVFKTASDGVELALDVAGGGLEETSLDEDHDLLVDEEVLQALQGEPI